MIVKQVRATMKRLKGFDYTKPYFYMVTLKRDRGLLPFSEITREKEPPKDEKGRGRYLIANELTAAVAQVIREFHTKWWGLWPIDCFIVMPDHIHLLIHIKDTGDQLALGKYVYQLMKALTAVYWGMADGTAAAGMASTGPKTMAPMALATKAVWILRLGARGMARNFMATRRAIISAANTSIRVSFISAKASFQ